MRIGRILAASVAAVMLAQSATAAVIGSLDSSRTYQVTTTQGEVRDQSVTGNYYSNFRQHLESTGSTVAAATDRVTSEYLSGVNLFITGTPTLNGDVAGRASAAEQAALRDWVHAGGVALILGEMGSFNQTANTWFAPFGLSISGNHGGGTGRWTNSENALLDGVGTGVSLTAGGAVAGSYDDVLARYGSSATNGQIAIVGMQYGAGYLIASGDSSPFSNQSFRLFNTDGVTPSSTAVFTSNIVGLADNIAPIPVPATLPLILAGLGAIGVLRRRRRA